MGLGETVTFTLRHNPRFDTVEEGVAKDLVSRVRAQRPDSGDREQVVRCENCPVVAVYRLLSIRDTQRRRLRQRLRALLAAVVAAVLLMALPWTNLLNHYGMLFHVAGLALVVLAFAAVVWLLIATFETGAHPVVARGKRFLPDGHRISVESR